MINVSNVRVSLDEALVADGAGLYRAAASALGVNRADIASLELVKRSVDARRKDDVHFNATLVVSCSSVAQERKVLAGRTRLARGVKVSPHVQKPSLSIPDLSAIARSGEGERAFRPVVVGFGPAGMFAALYLAKAGLRPLVIERGGNVDERLRAVGRFNDGGALDLQTNIQFGEGGAGTFSDGKLTTGTKSPYADQVMRWFVEMGAPEEILWQAKPHIGTDRLVGVVRSMRECIERAGGSVRFHEQLVGLHMENGVLESIDVEDSRTGARERVHADALVLACGHSARDTFRMVRDAGLLMEQKPFSVGVRIEHPQRAIDRAQYGKAASHPALGAADYKLVVHLGQGRSVYSFCMCPGGEVVCATSEENSVVVNGMSSFARDGANANAALLVSVSPEDFPDKDPLAGVRFQQMIERAAYAAAVEAGGAPYQAPAQTVGDFLAKASGTPSASVRPTYARGVVWCDLAKCLPAFVTDSLREALPLLGRKLRGFDDADAVMTGVETRSSSPVRIVRERDLQARFAKDDRAAVGVYPCGEGPGYAGGIMSAACDGVKVAATIVASLQESADQGECADSLSAVADALKAGKPAIFPTDTVMGLGVSVCALESPFVLYRLKDRPADKPIAWLVGGAGDLDVYAKDVPGYAYLLAQAWWPGPLTLVVNAADGVSRSYVSERGTVGLRMPAYKLTLALIKAVGCPLATTSANIAGMPAVSEPADVDAELLERVGVMLGDDGSPKSGVASTVVDCTGERPRIVREGSITMRDIDNLLGA